MSTSPESEKSDKIKRKSAQNSVLRPSMYPHGSVRLLKRNGPALHYCILLPINFALQIQKCNGRKQHSAA